MKLDIRTIRVGDKLYVSARGTIYLHAGTLSIDVYPRGMNIGEEDEDEIEVTPSRTPSVPPVREPDPEPVREPVEEPVPA